MTVRSIESGVAPQTLFQRLVRPGRVSRSGVTRTLIAVAATVAIFAILLELLGSDIGSATSAIVNGSVGSVFQLGQTIMITSLLALTGLAAAIPFRAHLWNVGGEGQMWFGAFVTVALALTLPKTWPHGLFLVVLVLLSMVAGAVWGLVPGIMKALINANEVITSLMMTFVAIELGNWAIEGIWPQGSSNQTVDVPSNTLMPNIWHGTLVTLGAPLALLAVVVAWILISRTRFGFEISAIGLNPNASRMSGMSLKRVAIVSFALGGAFAGLAGGVFILGINGALPSGFDQSNFGYLGIAVALIARLRPGWIIPSAFLFAILRVGSDALQAQTGLSTTIGQLLTALLIVLLLAFRLVRLTYPEAAR